MKKFIAISIILIILTINFGIALCECECNQECKISIDSIIATVNNFNVIKVKIGEFEGKYTKNDLEWELVSIPLVCQDKNIAIKVINGAGTELYNSIIVIDSTKKEVVVDYKDDCDKKVNFTITFNMECPVSESPTSTSTNNETSTPTLEPSPTITQSLEPSPTISVTVTPVTTLSTTPGNDEELPQTGEALNIVALIVSFMFIIGGLILFFRHRHTHE